MKNRNKLKVTKYHVDDLKMRIALITDLHDMNYGDLVEVIRQENPDVILLAGDIIERTDEKLSGLTNKQMEESQTKVYGRNLLVDGIGRILDVICTSSAYGRDHFGMEFIERVSAIAPTFYSVGNHEWYFSSEDLAFFERHGVKVLDNADTEIEIKGNRFLVGGLSTRYDLEWLKQFSAKEGYKILMCHHPEHYRYMIKGSDLDSFELVVGGHYHGGQWRIKGRSLYVPRMGFMKRDMVGQFGKLIISAGAVNTSRLPRLGNPCELVMIEG